MSIRQDVLKEVCDLASSQVRALYPNLDLAFIPHRNGQLHEIIESGEHGLARTGIGKTALGILDKSHNRELSSFLGMAIDHKVKWFGLASTDNLLGIFNINLDEFENAKKLRHTVYHLLWHAIDLVEVRRRPEYANKFRSGPMIPKRSPMNLAKLNLQADVFSAVMCQLQGEGDAIHQLAHQRAIDSVIPIHARRAEDYPFVIALESAQYAWRELAALKPQRNKFMSYALKLAVEMGKTFDDQSIRHWWGFSEPAQDMAWRSFAKDAILGCAVHTSDNPFVRASGHLVADITGIAPLSATRLAGFYNAFASQDQNQVLHRELMEKTFEEAMERGVREESGRPLIAAANQQNENLAEGAILGWCANALQAAGRAFESALSSGMSPAQAARLEFAGSKDTTSWDTLKKIGESIVSQKRLGFAVTLGNVAEIANSNPSFAPVLSSIRVTMKDPSYVQKLEAANDLAMRAPAPSAPAPQAPAPKGPAPQAQAFQAPLPPSMPGLGGSSNAAARHRAALLAAERARQAAGDQNARQEDHVE